MALTMERYRASRDSGKEADAASRREMRRRPAAPCQISG